MGIRYGQLITWGTASAPKPFAGICRGYSYNDQLTRQLVDNEAGDNIAVVEHSAKAAISFEAEVTADSTDFIDLSSGAAITLTGINAGLVLVSEAVETWSLLQPKKVSIQATHYPDMTQTGTPPAPGTLSAVTPDQTGLGIIHPGGVITFSTYGMTHAAGVLHELEIRQQITIAEDEASTDGKLLGAEMHGYLRTIRARILAKSTAPVKGTTFSLTGGPDHAADYLVESVNTAFADKRGKMYEVNALWIPPFSA